MAHRPLLGFFQLCWLGLHSLLGLFGLLHLCSFVPGQGFRFTEFCSLLEIDSFLQVVGCHSSPGTKFVEWKRISRAPHGDRVDWNTQLFHQVFENHICGSEDPEVTLVVVWSFLQVDDHGFLGKEREVCDVPQTHRGAGDDTQISFPAMHVSFIPFNFVQTLPKVDMRIFGALVFVVCPQFAQFAFVALALLTPCHCVVVDPRSHSHVEVAFELVPTFGVGAPFGVHAPVKVRDLGVALQTRFPVDSV
mmetsp:Transcript_3357/g.4909  ORF Transcript_3357/g.4909 Transcript_3357/m.4909 type:complete len:248 (-) Transcript_3357:427-1170(-)